MIVVDTSAVAAIAFGEDSAAELLDIMANEQCVMSAASRVELGIVIEARLGPSGIQLVEELLLRCDIDIVAFDQTDAASAIMAWRRFGKGRHTAGLNFGDCFSYALAHRLGAPLLFTGDDFRLTDLPIAVVPAD